jgi:transcription elongation GreA/GreB family factor
MNHLKILKNYLFQEIEKTDKTLISLRIARANAPSAMESKSDTSRSKLESEVTMHELKLIELKKTLNSIPNDKKITNKIELWSFVGVELPSGKLHLMIVTGGLGGTKIDEMQCVSDKAPMGSALMGKKQGEEFSFNETVGKVISIE